MSVSKEECLRKKPVSKRAKEIFFAVISTTITLVAVFFPIVFMDGMTGRLFREFSIVVSGSVIISSFAALTFTPMLATKLLIKREKQSWFYRKTEPFFEAHEPHLQPFFSSFPTQTLDCTALYGSNHSDHWLSMELHSRGNGAAGRPFANQHQHTRRRSVSPTNIFVTIRKTSTCL